MHVTNLSGLILGHHALAAGVGPNAESSICLEMSCLQLHMCSK